MWASDLEDASLLAHKALELDFDCEAAARILARIASRSPTIPTDEMVICAEVCLARSLLKIAETERRLVGACDTCLAKSRRALEYRKRLTLRHWHALADWPPVGAEIPQPGDAQDIPHIRHFVRDWVLTFGDDSRAHRRLQSNPVFRSVVDRFIENTLKHSGLPKQESADADLSHEVIRVLNNTTWLPSPAFSTDELGGQLIAFLAHRIDREIITGKSKRKECRQQDVELLLDQSHPGHDNTMNMIETMDVDCVLSHLPDQQRAAFRLFMDQVPPARIATKMKITRSEVINLVKHAQRHLASLPEVQQMNKD